MSLRRNEKLVVSVEAIILVALIVFAFNINVWPEVIKSYYLAILMTASAIAVIIGIGYKKDKNYFRSAAFRLVIVNILAFSIVSYGLGIFLGLSRGFLSKSISSFFANFVPIVVLAVASEFLRYGVSSSYARKRLHYIAITVLIILVGVLGNLNPSTLTNSERIFVYICATVLPIIATESVVGYLCYRYGFLPALTYKLILALYPFVLPIIPNLGPYLHSVIMLTLAFATFMSCETLRKDFEKDQGKFRRYSLSLISVPLLILCTILVVLVAGIGRYKIVSIFSGSMEPTYARGDAVIFEKLEARDIQEGDILVFNHEGRIITHRVVSIDNSRGALSFNTQGDANEEPDNFHAGEADVLGRVKLYVKYIGYPSLWLSELFNGE